MSLPNNLTLNTLKILNWNANGLKPKKSTFSSFLVRHNIDIACLTETHLVNSEPFKIPGYAMYREDRTAPIASGGVAIFIKRSISHHSLFLPQLINIEAVAIKLNLSNNESLTIISAYKSPNRRLQVNDINNLFLLNTPTLLVGDLNCKHRFWGCRASNPNGERLLRIVSDFNINISAPEEATFHPWQINSQPDVLDIALHKQFHAPILQQVLPELDSDHLPVIVSFLLQPQFYPSLDRLINGQVKWDIFKTNLDELLNGASSLRSEEQIDLAVAHFTDCLKRATMRAITRKFPQRSNSFLHPPLRILNLIKEKHQVRRQWQRHRQPWMRRRLNQLIRQVKFELDSFKINSYRLYVHGLNPNDSSLWQATKRVLCKPTLVPPLREDGQYFQSDVEKCNVFADYFEKAFTPHDINDQATSELVDTTLNCKTQTVELPIKFTSPSEIFEIIKRLPLKKSPGTDQIPNIVLKNLTRKSLSYLASILNACISRGYFPNAWKEAEVIVIHKPNKPKQSPSSYRPISLLSSLSKLLEKIVQKRLLRFIDSSDTIIPHQFGFRPKHSTTHQIQRVAEIITKGFERKEHSVAVFLDVAQAFDKVWHNGLLYKVHSLGFPLYLQNLIKSFLLNRKFHVKLNYSCSSTRNVLAGVPQGSILGPLLFNIFTSDIPIPQNASLALYADDTAIITQHSDIQTAQQNLQISLDTTMEWFEKWKLRLNATKCEAKVFTLRKLHLPPNIVINNTEIEWNPPDRSVKYLGIHLDQKLNWNLHINYKLTQAYARLSLLFPVLNRKSSLKSKYGILIYKTILRPLVMYACPVWGLSISKSKRNKIQVFQNKILRLATNSAWFVRNKQIHKEFGVDSIDTFIKKTAEKFLNNIGLVPGAQYFNIGVESANRRLKPRLVQDILID